MCTVIFASNSTAVLRLCCVVVGVLTILYPRQSCTPEAPYLLLLCPGQGGGGAGADAGEDQAEAGDC